MLTREDLERIGKLLDGKLAPIEQRLDRVEQKVDRLKQMTEQDGEVLGEISANLMAVVEDHIARIKRLEDHTGLSHS